MTWKQEIEVNRKSVKLLQEVLKNQIPSQEDDTDMEVCSVDFSSQTLSKYK